MAKGDRFQSFSRAEASVWTTRLCSALKHYADTLYRLYALGWDWRAGCLERGPVRFGRGRLDSLRQKGLAAYLMCALRCEIGSASVGWPHWKEVSYAPPYGLSESFPGHLHPKGLGGQKHGGKRRRRPSINGQEVRQQGCLRAKLHCLNSSPPGPGPPFGKDAETRNLVVVGSFEESNELPGPTVAQ